MLLIKNIILLSIFYFAPWNLNASRQFVFTSGAYQGAYALGLELNTNHKFPSLISGGYTPIGSTQVSQLNLIQKYTITRLCYFKQKNFRLNIYAALLYNPSKKLFLSLPKRYPDNYYSPTALRYLFGAELKFQIAEKLTWSIQYGYLDSELQPVFAEQNLNLLKQIGSYGFSIYLEPFKKKLDKAMH